jgi:diadenosine tetraphosphate (Ap4A) HIT family hydrolase
VTDVGSIIGWDIFPFTADLQVKELEAPVVPEPPRGGEDGAPCGACDAPDSAFLWTNEHWRISRREEPSAVVHVMLQSRDHHDLADLPAELAADLGLMLQRIERALMATGRFGRMHVNRWGDGGSHFHVWLFARPLGAMQLRGFCLPLWDMLLPPMPREEWDAILDEVRANLDSP